MSAELAEAKTLGVTPDVAAEIRSHMGRRDVSQAELARRLGVENSWIGKRLNGQTEIGVSDLYRIARALEVKMVDLLPRDERDVTIREPPLGLTNGYAPSRPPRTPSMSSHPGDGRPANRPSSQRTRPTGRFGG